MTPPDADFSGARHESLGASDGQTHTARHESLGASDGQTHTTRHESSSASGGIDSVPDRPESPYNWIQHELQQLQAKGLLRELHATHVRPDGKLIHQGQLLWNFSSNDYLGLAADKRVCAAAAAACQEYGVGARASALVTGHSLIHNELENALSTFKGADAALLFPTGFAANLGTIGALVGAGDVVFCDRLNHASLIDGCRLSGAKFRVYPHNDVETLAKQLHRDRNFRRRLIVTDSLFSMDGDVARLTELSQLAADARAMLLVDEAHATGVLGTHGQGLVEETGVDSKSLVSIGTLSKALGGQGGFVTGSTDLIKWLSNSARTQMFSTALAPPLCAAALMALNIVKEEPQRRAWLLRVSETVQQWLREQGWHIPDNVRGPIIPVIIGEPTKTLDLADRLQRRGIHVAAIRPPTVPNGTSRLRISLSCAHQDAGIAALLQAFTDLKP